MILVLISKCIFQNIIWLYTYNIITTYLLHKLGTLFSLILLLSFLRYIWFIIQLLTTAMLGRDPGYNDMAWQMNPVRKAFHWNVPQICFVVYVMLYVPNTDFFNIVHLSAIVRHVKCTLLDCFYTHWQFESAISVLIFISLHIFCLHMFLTDSGWSYMAWQMMSLPPLGGISLIWSKNHFCSMYTSVSPPKHLFNIMNFVGIASHKTCTFLSDYSINFHEFMLISVYILIFLHIFVWECLA